MPKYELDEDLYADEEQDPLEGGQSTRLVTTVKYLLIAALFIVPILALLKPSFSQPPKPPTLSPTNGIQVQTTNFDALHKSSCTSEFCAGSL
ncbi:MAG: hypothetical protein JWN90_358 [Parcubacteria group bacterium]|nr:hypothetical protein [Parcubacteria group bacterium]